MTLILYVLSLIWITAGSCAILYTPETRNWSKNLVFKSDPKIMAALALIFGVLFLVAASASSQAWFIRLLGLAALVKGALFIFNPGDVWTKTTHWFLNAISDQAFRLVGIISVILGTVMMSWIG